MGLNENNAIRDSLGNVVGFDAESKLLMIEDGNVVTYYKPNAIEARFNLKVGTNLYYLKENRFEKEKLLADYKYELVRLNYKTGGYTFIKLSRGTGKIGQVSKRLIHVSE